jgi:hypothetical protein
LAVDAVSGMIVAQTLMDQEADGPSQVTPLLNQIDGPIAQVTADPPQATARTIQRPLRPRSAIQFNPASMTSRSERWVSSVSRDLTDASSFRNRRFFDSQQTGNKERRYADANDGGRPGRSHCRFSLLPNRGAVNSGGTIASSWRHHIFRRP